MKLISKFAFALAMLLSATNFSFATENPANPVITLEQQVLRLLGAPDIKPGTDVSMTITFLINNENEIEIVNVEGDHEFLKRYIRARLDEREIKDTKYPIHEVYTIPVRFVDKK